jgi:hypothetical protein
VPRGCSMEGNQLMGTSAEDYMRQAQASLLSAAHTNDPDQKNDRLGEVDTYNQLALAQLLLEIRNLLKPAIPMSSSDKEILRRQYGAPGTFENPIDISDDLAQAWREAHDQFCAEFNDESKLQCEHVNPYMIQQVMKQPPRWPVEDGVVDVTHLVAKAWNEGQAATVDAMSSLIPPDRGIALPKNPYKREEKS